MPEAMSCKASDGQLTFGALPPFCMALADAPLGVKEKKTTRLRIPKIEIREIDFLDITIPPFSSVNKVIQYRGLGEQ
jgi:hypothetical protein